MKELEEFYLGVRNRKKKDSRNAARAIADKNEFIELYRRNYSEHNDDKAVILSYAFSILDKLPKDLSITDVKKAINKHFNETKSSYDLDSYYQKCIEELEEIICPDDKDKIPALVKWLYYRFYNELKKDKSIILEVIHVSYIQIHSISIPITTQYFRKCASNRSVYNNLSNPDLKNIEEYKQNLLAEGFYYITKDTEDYNINDFFNYIYNHTNLSKNDKRIIDIAYNLNKKSNKFGNDPNLFKEEFKKQLARNGLSGNTKNQALRRLRKNLNSYPDLGEINLNIMGFMTSHKPTDDIPYEYEAKMKAFKILLDLVID